MTSSNGKAYAAAFVAMALTSGGACAGGASTTDGTNGDAGAESSSGVSVAPNGAAPVYVTTAGDDRASGASPASAVRSIQVAIDLAQKCAGAPCAVLVAAGTYAGSVTLRDGVSIYGQYGADFIARNPANVVTLTSTDDHAVIAGGHTNCPDACPLVNSDGVSDGADGVVGGDGAHGFGGVAATDRFGAFTSDGVWVGGAGTAGARGMNGTGGGGGGAGGTKRFRACFGCGTLLGGHGGQGASGGCGGGGGGAGGAGGGSFALVVINSVAALKSVDINGGAGGAGGAGGDG